MPNTTIIGINIHYKGWYKRRWYEGTKDDQNIQKIQLSAPKINQLSNDLSFTEFLLEVDKLLGDLGFTRVAR